MISGVWEKSAGLGHPVGPTRQQSWYSDGSYPMPNPTNTGNLIRGNDTPVLVVSHDSTLGSGAAGLVSTTNGSAALLSVPSDIRHGSPHQLWLSSRTVTR